MRYYLSLYLIYMKIALKRLLEHRTDAWITFWSTGIYQGMAILFISVIFIRMEKLEGWGFYESVLIYGLLTTSHYLWATFLYLPWSIPENIVTGDLDTLLVYPASPLFQLIGKTPIIYFGFGHMVVGIVAVIFALKGLNADFHFWWAFYIPLVVVSGALVFCSLLLLTACLSFWFVNVYSIMFPLNWFADFAQFPIVIYPLPLRFMLTWIFPYGMAGFYPAAYLLRGDEYRSYGLIATFAGFVLLGVALFVWKLAITKYQSTGS